MTLYKRYQGEYLGRRNTVWRTELWQEADGPFDVVGILDYPGEDALGIEWTHRDKEEPVCGSTATLHLVSPGDRTYEDLYTIKPGGIRMDVYRNGALYWSGTLDPEFYTEPYAYGSQYEVELIFSDFGVLDRLSYTLAGIRTLQELTEQALTLTGIRHGGLDQQYITTALTPGGSPMSLADLSVRSENFYDEEGKACSWQEVIEGIMQPLGLKMVQRAGKVYVYDLNGLYASETVEEVYWTDEDQTLGTDKVANKAKVTYSPYASSESSAEVEYKGESDEDMINVRTGCDSTEPEYYTFRPDYATISSSDYLNYLSFTIFLSRNGTGLKEIGTEARYFRILPLLGGEECDGVAYGFIAGCSSLAEGGRTVARILDGPWSAAKAGQTLLMRTLREPIQALEASDRNKYLRVCMDMMLDMRYNPFTETGDDNEKGNQEMADYRFNFVQIPASIVLYDEDGNALLHYSNRDIYEQKGLTDRLAASNQGTWETGAGSYGDCRLEWYSGEDRHYKSGVKGWQTNRHNIGLSLRDTTKGAKSLAAGQYLPYPPQGGYLEITIYSGVYIYEWSEKVDGAIKYAPDDWYDKIRWLLYKAPTVEVVNKNVTRSGVESEDIEYTGVINAQAKEDIELDTICGTSATVIATARGAYLRTSDHCMVKTLSRAGRTTQAEQLLIGTLYSQYAGRKTVLNGTARLMHGALGTCTEVCQPGKVFMLLADTQDTQTEESELDMAELRPDEYRDENNS